jgi:endonuclease YncB( thermonuclease family)
MQMVDGERKRDKYGRPIMRVFLPDGTNLGRKLLRERLALEYDGKRKASFCLGVGLFQ